MKKNKKVKNKKDNKSKFRNNLDSKKGIACACTGVGKQWITQGDTLTIKTR